MYAPGQREKVIATLDAVDDLTIATLREDGFPQATTVSFVNDGDIIYFGTSAQSQKARNIERDNRVSVTVNPIYKSWGDIKGLSLGGRARRVSGTEELSKIFTLMTGKFPQLMQYVQPQSGEDLALYRIDPEAISILDYTKGFGHTEYVEMRR
jgi:nitroimidazol reductase NimA-like FMN-containing flavoprotein (pyridoxamine 5'-phosphate oxidase superfamily)